MADIFTGRLGLQQRILPLYRTGFFDLLAQSCQEGLSLFAGNPTSEEAVSTVSQLNDATLWEANNFHLLTPGSRFYTCWQGGLVRWLGSWDPDALIVEANPRYLSTPRAIRWMHTRSRPVIGWGLGAPAGSGWLEKVRKWRQASFLQQFDALIVYSARGAEEYRTLGFPVDRITVAPNAVSPRPSAAPAPRPFEFDGPPTVLYVGRLVARKQVDHLIRACAALPPGLQPRLIIVGDGPERPELEKLATRLYPRSEFSGELHGADLEDSFSKADLFVLPGTGGLAVQEAVAHGLPVIVARGDGTQGDLVRQENGWNLVSDQPEELALTLEQALADPARLRAMGMASFRIAREEINLEKMVEVFVRVLNRFTT